MWIIAGPGMIAGQLWAFGEDDHAATVLGLHRATDLVPIWWLATRFDDPEIPLPIEGRGIDGGMVLAFAAVAHLESRLRPLARTRRRPQRELPEAIRIAQEDDLFGWHEERAAIEEHERRHATWTARDPRWRAHVARVGPELAGAGLLPPGPRRWPFGR
jgi:hypothetical protein